MLCEVVASGVSSRVKSGSVDGAKVKGDMDFDVVLCQSELMERALQLCHLLPPGFLPVSLDSYQPALCLTQWMLNRAEQPFILLCNPDLWQTEESDLCVYFSSVHVSVTLSLFSDSQPELLFLSLFAHPLFQQLLFLVFVAWGYVSYPIFLLKKTPTPALIPAGSLLFCSLDLPHIMTTRLMAAVSSLLRYVMGWQCLCCSPCLTKNYLHLCLSLQPCQSSQSFALDAVDSLVRCGILVMEEVRKCSGRFSETLHHLIFCSFEHPFHSLIFIHCSICIPAKTIKTLELFKCNIIKKS